jgi:hypothetical protein
LIQPEIPQSAYGGGLRRVDHLMKMSLRLTQSLTAVA